MNLSDNIVNYIDPAQYTFEKVSWLLPYKAVRDCFIVLTEKNKLVKYQIENKKVITKQVIDLKFKHAAANFTFDKNGNILIPTDEEYLLLTIDPATFELIDIRQFEQNSTAFDEITWCPIRKVYLTGNQLDWQITMWDEDFNIISQLDVQDMPIASFTNPEETLVSFLSFNQEPYYSIYELTDTGVNYLKTFYKTSYNNSRGLAFKGNDFAVTYRSDVEYYTYNNGQITQLWQIDLTKFGTSHQDVFIVFVDHNLMILGQGTKLHFADLENRKITRTEKLGDRDFIYGLFVDEQQDNLIIPTNKEILLHPIKNIKPRVRYPPVLISLFNN
jgi:hypothetical protein